jgi:hypothetical protein
MANVDTEIEFSPLSGSVTHDGVTLLVRIQRIAGGEWSLEVIDEDGVSTVWRNNFETDKGAFDEYRRTVDMWKVFARFSVLPGGPSAIRSAGQLE